MKDYEDSVGLSLKLQKLFLEEKRRGYLKARVVFDLRVDSAERVGEEGQRDGETVSRVVLVDCGDFSPFEVID